MHSWNVKVNTHKRPKRIKKELLFKVLNINQFKKYKKSCNYRNNNKLNLQSFYSNSHNNI